MAKTKRGAGSAAKPPKKSRASAKRKTETPRGAAVSGARSAAGAPVASRPHFPPGYGIPKHQKGLLPWSHVEEKMSAATHYWVSSVDPEGRPHSMPVDGIWLDGALFFGGAPTTRRSRNLQANPTACVHLESAMDVVILEGEAIAVREPGPELLDRLVEMTRKKYGWAPTPEQFAGGGMLAFRPRLAFAWKDFPKDATRWRLEPEST